MSFLKQCAFALMAGLAAGSAGVAADLGPADPLAPTAPPIYRSTFETYKPFREESVADWRSLNEEVGRVGGHKGAMGGMPGHGAAKPPIPADGGQTPVRAAPTAPGGAHSH